LRPREIFLAGLTRALTHKQEKRMDDKVFEKLKEMTKEQLDRALINAGVDLNCGGCACLFFTGWGKAHDQKCRVRGEDNIPF